MVTTSHSPSSRLKQFAKELRLLFPNSQRLNRGNYVMSQLVQACRANDVTDLIIAHEHRGEPGIFVDLCLTLNMLTATMVAHGMYSQTADGDLSRPHHVLVFT